MLISSCKYFKVRWLYNVPIPCCKYYIAYTIFDSVVYCILEGYVLIPLDDSAFKLRTYMCSGAELYVHTCMCNNSEYLDGRDTSARNPNVAQVHVDFLAIPSHILDV